MQKNEKNNGISNLFCRVVAVISSIVAIGATTYAISTNVIARTPSREAINACQRIEKVEESDNSQNIAISVLQSQLTTLIDGQRRIEGLLQHDFDVRGDVRGVK